MLVQTKNYYFLEVEAVCRYNHMWYSLAEGYWNFPNATVISLKPSFCPTCANFHVPRSKAISISKRSGIYSSWVIRVGDLPYKSSSKELKPTFQKCKIQLEEIVFEDL